MVKLCPYCGAELNANAKFCDICGHDLEKSVPVKTKTEFKSNNEFIEETLVKKIDESEASPEDEGKNKVKKVLIVVEIIVLIFAVIGFIYASGAFTPEYKIHVTGSVLTVAGDSDDPVYVYSVKGLISNMSDDIGSYSIVTSFYDSDNDLVSKQVYNLSTAYEGKYTDGMLMGAYFSSSYVNMSHVQIEFLDKNKHILDNTTYNFNMSKMHDRDF